MRTQHYRQMAAGCALLLALAGCASQPSHREDRLEQMNRKIFGFNKAIDEAILKPVAMTYQRLAPVPVNRGVTNFFSNLDDVGVVANDLLQLKLKRAGLDGIRLLMNTTFGLAGLVDVATTFGFPKHYEDFGQTLGYWGVPPGSYLVLPFLGPSTLRDTGGMFVDATFDPLTYTSTNDVKTRNLGIAATAVSTIDLRADILAAEDVLKEAALDEYAYMRDAFLQRRTYLIHDGNVPSTDEEEIDDLFDDLE